MIWNTTDWTAEAESGYNCAAFSKDGKLLALGGPDLAPRHFGQLDKDAPEAKEKIPCFVSTLAFSPDGDTLAAGCLEGTVRLLKVAP